MLVLLVLATPLTIAAAVTLHELEHHGQVEHRHRDDLLLMALHGHSHDQGLEEHDHPAIDTPIGKLLRSTTSIAPATTRSQPGAIFAAVLPHLSPPLSPGRTAARLCTWRL
jgi:hypothetical protein